MVSRRKKTAHTADVTEVEEKVEDEKEKKDYEKPEVEEESEVKPDRHGPLPSALGC